MTIGGQVDPAPALEALAEAGIREADILVTLGSGHTSPWKSESLTRIEYGEIPGWHVPGVHGHHGELSLVRVGGENLMVMEGRHHYYEARSFQGVIHPIVVARSLGARIVLLMNSAGAIRAELAPGDLVLTAGHLSLHKILISNAREPAGTCVDRECYWEAGRRAMRSAARSCGIVLEEGVLMWVTGPTYETPAEVRMARSLGADVVAMSLAPEAVVAHRTGMKAVGLSLVTNRAISTPGERTDHNDVVGAAQRSQPVLDRILRAGVPLLSEALRNEQARS